MVLRKTIRMVLLAGFFLCSQWVRSGEILVVMGKAFALDKMSIKQLENIYRRKTIINQAGERWNPIHLSANDPLRIAFTQKLFQQPPEVMEAYWNTQYFQGIMPPYAVNSVEAMLRVLETTPGSIGYILPCQLDKRVKVIIKLTVDDPLDEHCEHTIGTLEK